MFSVDDAREVRIRKATVNHETYRGLYDTVCQRIKNRAEYAPVSNLTFNVPAFVVGRPLYDREHAFRYVRDKLVYNGFQVTQCGDYSLLVDWSVDPIRRKRRRQRRRSTTTVPFGRTSEPATTAPASDKPPDTKSLTRALRQRLENLRSKFVKAS